MSVLGCVTFSSMSNLTVPHITWLIGSSSAIAYYDLVLYSISATFIGPQFFPQTGNFFATFWALYIAEIFRAVSGFVFGHYSDFCGRKPIFLKIFTGIALSTLLMGILPSYTTIGNLASILFTAGLVTQNIFFGALTPSAYTILFEHLGKSPSGLSFGILNALVGLAPAIGSLVLWIIAKIITPSALNYWGFRIPWFLGGIVTLFLIFPLQHSLSETPTFLHFKNSLKQQPKYSKLLLGNFKRIFLGQGMILLPLTISIIKLILPAYLLNFYHFGVKPIFCSMAVGYGIAAVVLKPLFGHLADRYDKSLILLAAASSFLIGVYPAFKWLESGQNWALWFFVLFTNLITSATAASFSALLPQLFPTAIRTTAVGIAQGSARLLSASVPVLITCFYSTSKPQNYLFLFFLGLAAFSIYCTIAIRRLMYHEH